MEEYIKMLFKDVAETVVELIRRAETVLPEDVEAALKQARKVESNETARKQLDNILENIRISREKSIPLCQDTGILKFYLGIGENLNIGINQIISGILKGSKRAMDEVPLRPNLVDPITRELADSLLIEQEILPEKDYLELVVLPKGAGSENMSCFKMLNPSDGVDGIKKFILDSVKKAGGNPCPPVILGIGIGGSAENAMVLAKRSLLRKLDEKNQGKDIAKLEDKILQEVNALGIGPMGLGGDTTCIGVNIEIAGCHIASLPVAVNIQCWANRRAGVRVYKNRIKWF